MASKSKRRKLTIPDLDEVESRTKSVNKAIADFKSATEAIMAISLEAIGPRLLESMTEHQIVLLLVCKFGVDLVCKATSESYDLPVDAPPHVKRKYRECIGLDSPEYSHADDGGADLSLPRYPAKCLKIVVRHPRLIATTDRHMHTV